ncbi:transposase family protein [Streptomyces sp. NPDC057592]|uniref:transposase family protein n=1 Tax=unclassified Streptomyces TaxID=2593676 RepID=UPI0036B5D520
MPGAVCPGCGSRSLRVHSSYLRFPADVPSGGRQVVLCLRVRRFLPGHLVRAADLRGTAARVDPSVRSADRAPAVDAGRGGPRARWSGRCPHGESVRRVREPQHGAAAGRSVARPRSSSPAGGRCR